MVRTSEEHVSHYGIIVDEYDAALLRPETIVGVADVLRDGGKLLLGFTDEEGTHLQVLFVWGVETVGAPRNGLRYNDLFVTLIGFGGFGFSVPGESDPGYIASKIGFDKYGDSSTSKKVAELINGIRKALVR